MATRQFLLTYDDEEHYDIHQFLNSIPSKQKSKYVRIALQEFLRNKGMTQSQTPVNIDVNVKSVQNEPTSPKVNNDHYIEADPAIFDLGK